MKLPTPALKAEQYNFGQRGLCLPVFAAKHEANYFPIRGFQSLLVLNLLEELFFHQVNKTAPHPGSVLGLQADAARRVPWKGNTCHRTKGGKTALRLCQLKDHPVPRAKSMALAHS